MKRLAAVFTIALALGAINLASEAATQEKGPERDRGVSHSKRSARPVQLEAGEVGSSVWEDGTISIAVPIINSGTETAFNVHVKSISLNGKPRGAQLFSLGEILPSESAVLRTTFSGPPPNTSYLLQISGAYEVSGKKSNFSVKRQILPVESPGDETMPSDTTNVEVHFPGGVLLPPSSIMPELEGTNPPTPPVPEGPPQMLVAVPPEESSAVPQGSAPPAGSAAVEFIRDTGGNPPGGLPPDPTAATVCLPGTPLALCGMGIVLATGNTYLLVSTDGGGTFTQIDPTTIFPQSDGGLCCDQVVIYNPSINLFFWLLQYECSPATVRCIGTSTAGSVSQNRLRIAFASPEAIRANIPNLQLAFTYFDLQPSNFGLPNNWFDYPDIAFTNSNLYVSATSQPLPGYATPTTTCQQLSGGFIVVHKALAEISALAAQPGPVPGPTPVGFFGPNSPKGNSNTVASWKQAICDTGDSRLTQSSADAMYWAGHKDTSTLHFWQNTGNATRHSTVNNRQYSNTDYTSTAPDGLQWIDNRQKSMGTDAVLGATRLGDQVWFAWGAGRNNSAGRPQPYIQIAGIDISTLKQVQAYDIWNSSYAFAYPSLATEVGGTRVQNIGVSLAWGGSPSNNYGSTAVGFLGDHVVYYTELSDVTFNATTASGAQIPRFGDFFVVRRFDRPGGSAFSSQGYAARLVNPSMSTSCATPLPGPTPSCTIHPHYVEWRRPPIE